MLSRLWAMLSESKHDYSGTICTLKCSWCQQSDLCESAFLSGQHYFYLNNVCFPLECLRLLVYVHPCSKLVIYNMTSESERENQSIIILVHQWITTTRTNEIPTCLISLHASKLVRKNATLFPWFKIGKGGGGVSLVEKISIQICACLWLSAPFIHLCNRTGISISGLLISTPVTTWIDVNILPT